MEFGHVMFIVYWWGGHFIQPLVSLGGHLDGLW